MIEGTIHKITDEVGAAFTGQYKGSQAMPSKFNKPLTVHTLEIEGEPFHFWGFTAINNALNDKIGKHVQIVYTGQVQEEGRYPRHTVTVGDAPDVPCQFKDGNDDCGQTVPEDLGNNRAKKMSQMGRKAGPVCNSCWNAGGHFKAWAAWSESH